MAKPTRSVATTPPRGFNTLQLTSVICTPLLRVLALPKHTHRVSVLAEFGFCSLDIMHSAAVHGLHVLLNKLCRTVRPVPLAARLYRDDGLLPKADQFSTVSKNAFRLQPTHWSVVCKGVKLDLAHNAFITYSNEQVATHLTTAQPNTPLAQFIAGRHQPASYLALDDRLVLCHRARLRFDMALLNRHRLNCPLCKKYTSLPGWRVLNPR